MSQSQNPIWDYFCRVDANASKAKCCQCSKQLSLGSDKSSEKTVHGLKCHLGKVTKTYVLRTWRKLSHIGVKKCHQLIFYVRFMHNCVAYTDLDTNDVRKCALLIFSFYFFFVFGRKWVVFLFFVYFSAEKTILYCTFGCFIFYGKRKIIFGRPLLSSQLLNVGPSRFHFFFCIIL